MIKSPHIIVGNALADDWKTLLTPAKCSYIFGNPPFVGHQWRTAPQQGDMALIWGSHGQFNRLDYVTCWFKKAKDYAATNSKIEIAFVSTNSITQGEQCGILWPAMLSGGLSIRFAHRTFQWNNEARGKAAVHCVIIGMTGSPNPQRLIYEYDHVRGDAHVSKVSQINGYLIDGPQYSVPARTQAPQGRLKLHKGSQPTDGARLDRVRAGRLQSPTESVKAFAKFPTLFTQDRQPSVDYLAIPEVSSETRDYIPMVKLTPDVIASNKLQIIPGASMIDFGILTSAMHMAWMRAVGGA